MLNEIQEKLMQDCKSAMLSLMEKSLDHARGMDAFQVSGMEAELEMVRAAEGVDNSEMLVYFYYEYGKSLERLLWQEREASDV